MRQIELSQDYIEHFNITNHSYIAHGGQKTVFKVTINDENFALKLVHAADKRFIREIEISERFGGQKGLPVIKSINIIEDKTIILEQFIEGQDLTEIRADFIGDEERVCHLIYQVSEILEPIWSERFVHRDLKPGNIRISTDQQPYILDFGIARALDAESITFTGHQPMSYLYASPEQYAGKKELIKYRTDFFCLGIIAYELFTGTLPFGSSRQEIEQAFLKRQSYRETKNDRIDEFCKRVLALAPSARPGKIEQFKKLLLI